MKHLRAIGRGTPGNKVRFISDEAGVRPGDARGKGSDIAPYGPTNEGTSLELLPLLLVGVLLFFILFRKD